MSTPFCRVATALAILCLVACDDPPKKLGLGASCDDDGACASGFCFDGACLDPEGDEDDDGLQNRLEVLLATNPLSADSDDDGVRDGEEIGPDPERPLD